MFKLIIFFFELLFKSINCNEKNLIVRNAILEKEVSILKRRIDINNNRINFKHTEKLIFALTQNLSSINNLFTVVKTDTVLKWYKIYIKKKWTFSNKKKSGRPTVNKEVVKLVLAMKNSNIMWGCRRISHELQKVNISISHEAVRKIISNSRKKGKIKKSLTWNKFIKSHLTSLYSMDFFTVDSIWGKHYYTLVILEIKTRKIVQFAITEYPIREFVRQQIIEFTNNIAGLKYLIHDRAPEFCSIDYSEYGIKNVKTSVKSPNMNSYIERVIGTIQREALDWFIIFNQKQLYNILKRYIHYYNSCRPHQGIGKIPINYTNLNNGNITKKPILNGLHNHYFRVA